MFMPYIFIIIILIVAFIVIFKDSITIVFVNILNHFFPDYIGISQVPLRQSTKESIVVLAMITCMCISTGIFIFIENKIKDRKYQKHKKEQEEIKTAFTAEFDVPGLLEQVEEITLLPETVEENHYHHARSTYDKSKWGVYIGRYFLKCNCTVKTFRCVKLLRLNGIPVAYDDKCIYEK